QLIAVRIGEIDRDACGPSMNLWPIVGDVKPSQTLYRLVNFLGLDAKGKMEEAGVGFGRIFRILYEQIKTIIPDFDERGNGAPGLLIFLVEPSRPADLAAEEVLIKLDRAVQLFYHKRQVINFRLHSETLL